MLPSNFKCPLMFYSQFNQYTCFACFLCDGRSFFITFYMMDTLFPPSIVTIVDNLFSYPYLRFVNIPMIFIDPCSQSSYPYDNSLDWSLKQSLCDVMVLRWFNLNFSTIGGFGMTMTHRRAAVFTARRIELCEIVQTTLSYLHPDSRVHSYLSPLPYQVKVVCNFVMLLFVICLACL